MAYTAEISRSHPTCIVFVVDESTSMREKLETGRSKAEFVADVLNKTLYSLITLCTKADGIRDYFHLGVVAYSGTNARNGFKGTLSYKVLNPISTVANNPLRIEERLRKVRVEDGEVTQHRTKFPVWFEPKAQGKTSMCAGLAMGETVVRDWCLANSGAFPPTLIHITDGHPTDGDPESVADSIKRLATEDGGCLIFNLHVDVGSGRPILFPETASVLSDRYAAKLFRMSSRLPVHVLAAARAKGYPVTEMSRGFIFNASPEAIVDFFEIGTRPMGMSER